MFPRSTSPEPGRHGTFRDCIERLPYVAKLGFDVIYLPPIHPIGEQFRKGKNNAVSAQPGEPGSPWAIGAAAGGHKAIHPELGTLDNFRALIAAAKGHGIDIAIDIAFQSSPDHPYVKEHPEWFRHRPDGTVQYAENPPKKYQDIYPFDFESPACQSLWRELTDVVLYWCEQGVRIFRVDNPHTKPFAFWEFLISEVKARFPEVILLSEAFTRPKIMYRLAKLGFTQSYTYFTWRNSKQEFVEYLTELTQTKVHEFFQPNFWPNTPDILPPHIQTGGRPASIARVVLAATLSSNYGMYGPVYELLETTPREEGSEEYLNSEKYEIRHWNLDQPNRLQHTIAALNHARRAHPALQQNRTLRFHSIDNDQILCYSKQSADRSDTVLCVVNLDFHQAQQGWLQLPLVALGLDPNRAVDVVDLLDGSAFQWTGERNFVALDPHVRPAHVFHLRQ
jgi:starch synthase (maltosyl-transferring)